MRKFINKYIWFLILLVGSFGVITLYNELNLLRLTGSLVNGQILAVATAKEGMPIGVALFMEAFCSIHMSVFVLIPLSKIFGKENYKKLFMTLFVIRWIILLIGDFISPMAMAIIDFFSVFIGAFIMVPVSALMAGVKIDSRSNQVIEDNQISIVKDIDITKELAHTGVGDKEVLKKALIMQYADINRAFYVRDNDKLRELCSPGVYMDCKVKWELYDKAGETPKIENVDFYEVTLVYCKKHGSELFVDLNIKYSCLEYVVDQNNNIVRGNRNEYKNYSKMISFSRKLSNDLLLKCPNCGASIQDDSEECDYCRTVLNFKIGDWVLKKETLLYEGIEERE